jgi:hypothetical protein
VVFIGGVFYQFVRGVERAVLVLSGGFRQQGSDLLHDSTFSQNFLFYLKNKYTKIEKICPKNANTQE